MKEYPVITFELIHQKEDGSIERLVLSRTQMAEKDGKYLVQIVMSQDELKVMQEALKIKREQVIAYVGEKLNNEEVKKI